IYQSEHWNYGAFEYRFFVPNGAYNVKLKFSEIYHAFMSAGQRVFNVSINGTQVLTGFDVVAQAGGPYISLDRTFPVDVLDGEIRIALTPVVSTPKVNAIEITLR